MIGGGYFQVQGISVFVFYKQRERISSFTKQGGTTRDRP